jgi:hypothetical protein
MTAPKSVLRRRRTSSVSGDIPVELVAWFEGRGDTPWCALLPEDAELLPQRWAAYKRAHPEAVPPRGWERACGDA